MTRTSSAQRRHRLTLDSASLERHQVDRLNGLLRTILPGNAFYEAKLAGLPSQIESLDGLARLPFTYKSELQSSKLPGDLAANLTYPLERYVRYHQTSGTRGRPLVVLDTADDWEWWLDAWQYVFDASQWSERERVFLAFSFGPFVGFWSAFDAACARGCLVIPSGGRSSLERLELIRNSNATALCCTPSYALHLAEIGAEHAIRVADLPVEKIVVAGEPGGSVPDIRAAIERAWQAEVFDHAGASEAGPWGFADAERTGLHVNEAEFIAEFLSVETGSPAGEGELAELVLTNLGRAGCPVLRYRTGDLVRPRWQHSAACRFVLLEGGVLGRVDDMLIIRGVNIFPSAIEQILRGFPEIREYRITARTRAQLDELEIEIEDRLQQPHRVAEELRVRLGLRVEVRCAPLGSLPRFEGKGRRFVDQRERGARGEREA